MFSKKKDLKSGMLVGLREGLEGTGVVLLKNCFMVFETKHNKYYYNDRQWDCLENYNDDLTSIEDDGLDIVGVYRFLSDNKDVDYIGEENLAYIDIDKERKKVNTKEDFKIVRKGKYKVEAKYIVNGETKLKSHACCHKSDKFDFAVGSRIAFNRLLNKMNK